MAWTVGRQTGIGTALGRAPAALCLPAGPGTPVGSIFVCIRGVGSRSRHAGVGDFLASQRRLRRRVEEGHAMYIWERPGLGEVTAPAPGPVNVGLRSGPPYLRFDNLDR